MKKTGIGWRRGVAGALAAALLAATLTGCDKAATGMISAVGELLPEVVPGQTVSEDSKWVNSSIVGSLEEATPTNKRDDFYTAVNRDWLLETELPENRLSTGPFEEGQESLENRLVSILLGTPDEKANPANVLPGLPAARVDHDLELVRALAALARDEAGREAAGVQPARPYIEAVQGITDMEEMTAFLCNRDGKNIALNYLVPFDVAVPYTERTAYVVTVGNTPKLTLGSDYNYRALNLEALLYKSLAFRKTSYLLGRLGRSEAEIRAVFLRCLQFEQKLAHSLFDTSQMSEGDINLLYEMQDNSFTKAELRTLQGGYPLVETLESCGMADTDRYIVAEPDYLRAVGRLYTEENLEEIKAYFLVHSVNTLLPLLDAESCAVAAELGSSTPEDAAPETDASAEAAEKEAPGVKQAMATINDYILPYLGGPLQQIYVTRYCTVAQKARMQGMIEEIMTAYRAMLQSEEWMGEETRAKALEKLDLMVVHNLYPDTFIDYTPLNLRGADNLVEAVAAIRRFDRQKQNDRIGRPITADYWDLSSRSTTLVNAFYIPTENSINLMAGLFSGDFFYSDIMSDELLLARTGTIIGHEISHAFDATGADYDSAGYKTNWWTTEDYDRYRVRTGHLIKEYNTQYLAPGLPSSSYGDQVNAEAVADMAGVKVALLVAEEKPNFDYDAFFTAYAQLWRTKYAFKSIFSMMTDEHPQGFLRANKTLQQFDAFITTYHLTPGDGMYLAPENRITVW